ncbi:MAG: toll/interleukin-1 receptor domain-containing protein [Planctomycetes bacterium]|nr:toll/interleukin-1 receptor domain-containing protein [Planctomycetota bacterium]
MSGRNIFEDLRKAGGPSARRCVFISHNSVDKAFARKIAQAVMSLGADVYFDEADKELQDATAMGNERAIVECILRGLSSCTHLLGIVTSSTKDSWWVPFEIGGAMGKARSCAHIVSEQVQSLPEYIKTAELLLDRWDLSKWVAKVSGEKHDVLKESIERHAGAFLGMVPRIRHKSEIRFYG